MRGSCKCSCRDTTPLQVFGSSGSTVITPAFITPPNTPCGCSDVLSHPLFITSPHLSHPQTHLVGVWTSYHTSWFITPPLGPLRAALYHPGYTRYNTPHRIPHPVIIFSIPTCYHRGVLSCVSYGSHESHLFLVVWARSEIHGVYEPCPPRRRPLLGTGYPVSILGPCQYTWHPLDYTVSQHYGLQNTDYPAVLAMSRAWKHLLVV